MKIRKVLVVDDDAINRQLLSKILHDEYEILNAADGKEALEMISHWSESISAVMLDLVMPEMDGYEVLKYMREDEKTSLIPVIVMTASTDDAAEVRALSLGANDYIQKPYNPTIIKHRLWNTINLRETSALANAAKFDDLTGLYNRNAFFRAAEEMISDHDPGYYIMACFDIDNFKVINDQCGSKKGDEVLQYIANVFEKGFGKVGGICCRIMADHFAVLYPDNFKNSREIIKIRQESSVLDGSILPITFSIGRYLVDDLSLSASAMYDRASIARASVKGRFDVHIAQYNEDMRQKLIREQEITSEMKLALENRQFEAWLQPQYDHAQGTLIGAEALVRWNHPKKGIIFPGDFIPVFEKNGFIYELDKYVWEEACRLLRKWINAGNSPLPVSVNLSRYDLFRNDLLEVLTGLVKRYELPVDLLRLEITESAFAQSTNQIITVVKRLMAYGFTIEIDDFGSGYSSLNTLKDVPAHVLKLDMRFLEKGENSKRSSSILESIVRMAKWLGMSVIAEGVETKEQADYLKSIGCNHVQGYLYARPMPVREYETLAGNLVS